VRRAWHFFFLPDFHIFGHVLTNLSPFNAKSPLGFWHMTTTHQKKFHKKKKKHIGWQCSKFRLLPKKTKKEKEIRNSKIEQKSHWLAV
jgi:hypothetical protein